MRLEDLSAYVAELDLLNKFEVKTEDDGVGHLIVISTKETYIFEDEKEADDKISEAISNPLCISHSKKYKAGKINKAGDVVKPETWTVVIQLNH